MASLGGVTLVTAWIAGRERARLAALAPRSAAARSARADWRSRAWRSRSLLPWALGTRGARGGAEAPGPAGGRAGAGQHRRRDQVGGTSPARDPGAVPRALRSGDACAHAAAIDRAGRRRRPAAICGGRWIRRSRSPASRRVAAFLCSPASPISPSIPRRCGRYYNAAGMFLPDGTHRTGVRQAPPRAASANACRSSAGSPSSARSSWARPEWTPGREGVLFPGPGGRFGCLICFESIFPDLARDDVRRGARWLRQRHQRRMVRPQCRDSSSTRPWRSSARSENHVPLARCANTGLTLLGGRQRPRGGSAADRGVRRADPRLAAAGTAHALHAHRRLARSPRARHRSGVAVAGAEARIADPRALTVPLAPLGIAFHPPSPTPARSNASVVPREARAMSHSRGRSRGHRTGRAHHALAILEERRFPVRELRLARQRSIRGADRWRSRAARTPVGSGERRILRRHRPRGVHVAPTR